MFRDVILSPMDLIILIVAIVYLFVAIIRLVDTQKLIHLVVVIMILVSLVIFVINKKHDYTNDLIREQTVLIQELIDYTDAEQTNPD